MKEVHLSKGMVALVDEEDYPLVSTHAWAAQCCDGKWYAKRTTSKRVNGVRFTAGLLMHRLILSAPPGWQVDHINGDTLDNRRANLRLATASQNQANRRYVCGKSPYKGVAVSGKRWRAGIIVNGKRIGLGSFDCDKEAARAYDAAASLHFGEFAYLNFPDAAPTERSE